MAKYRVDMQAMLSIVVDATNEDEAESKALKELLNRNTSSYWEVVDNGIECIE